jgi:elongation factor 1-alpha
MNEKKWESKKKRGCLLTCRLDRNYYNPGWDVVQFAERVGRNERDRGITIEVFLRRFETERFNVSALNCPGHRDFAANTIQGIALADFGMLVVSAAEGEFEAGMADGTYSVGGTRDNGLLAFSLGLSRLIVAVNKMDEKSVSFSQQRFNKVSHEVETLLQKIGYAKDAYEIVPVSAWGKENLIEKSAKMPWQKSTLLQAIDRLKPPKRPIDAPLRVSLFESHRIGGIGTVLTGRVISGVLKPGPVTIAPIELNCQVKTIEMHHKNLASAGPGDIVGVHLPHVSKKEVKHGMVLCIKANPSSAVVRFTARIVVVRHPTTIKCGYTPVLFCHSIRIPCAFVRFELKLDRRTGAIKEENPESIKAGDGCIALMQPLNPICIERFADIPRLGRFVLRDARITIGVGTVLETFVQ